MARQLRARKLSLKLDVIMEEEYNGVDDSFYSHFNESSFSSSLQSSQGTSLCSFTIRTTKQSNTNEPQFLHTGKWPRMDMVNELIDPVVKSLKDSGSGSTSPSTQNDVSDDWKTTYSTNSFVDTWEMITPDQLSMVMDYWDPDDDIYPLSIHKSAKQTTTDHTASSLAQPVTTAQELFFLREVMDEYLTRTQTVEYIEELEDNDSAIEIVATLEGYRQNGWSDEMIKAFPRESWLFWCSSGLASSSGFDESHVCDGNMSWMDSN